MTSTFRVRFRKKYVALQAQKGIKASTLKRAIKLKWQLIGGICFLYPYFSYWEKSDVLLPFQKIPRLKCLPCRSMKGRENEHCLLVYSSCPTSCICTNKVLQWSRETYLPSHKHIILQKERAKRRKVSYVGTLFKKPS